MRNSIIATFILLLSLYFNGRSYASTGQLQDTTKRGVVLYADARLTVLTKKHKDVKLGVIRSGRGYRVQIYTGTDRSKANQIRLDFMRRFPGQRTYLTYSVPQYRVKVGDFVDRKDAQRLYNSVRNIYNPSMIVQDLIEINTLKDD